MKILKRSKMTVQQRNLLLVATSILFVAAFVVGTSFTIRPVIAQQVTKLDKIQEEKLKTELKYDVSINPQSSEERLARQKAELEAMNRLAKLAKVSMAQAIEIATKEVSGTILECKLVVYNVKGKDPNSKESSQLFYSVRIATDQEEKHLLVNAIDGKVSTPTFMTVRDKN